MPMYQPRRVADPIVRADVVTPAESARFARSGHAPRHAAPTRTDRLVTRGSIALATLTATATTGAVVFGSGADAALAVGAAPAPAQAALVVEAAADAAPATEPAALNAEVLAAPGLGPAKSAAKALASQTPLFTKGALNVRKGPKETTALLGRLQLGVRVSATAEVDGDYRRIEFDTGYGWVLAAHLSDAAPIEAAGTTWEQCARGSSIEGRLRKDTVHIYRSVCALFPAVNSYGGWRSGGLPFHRNGRAVDIMLTPGAESALGWRIARYLVAHASVFNVDHIIFEQKIWTPSTPRWRSMADRGSVTANHFNHVHVAIRA